MLTIYKLYKINGYQGDSYYKILNEEILGYYISEEKAKLHPEYVRYMEKEEKRQEEWEAMTDEEKEEYNDEWDEPSYVDIIKINVVE